jgi:methionyl-tRNA synthetase
MGCEPSVFDYLGKYERTNYSNHSPLEGESKRTNEMKSDRVGGQKSNKENNPSPNRLTKSDSSTLPQGEGDKRVENFSFIRTTNPKHKKIVHDVWKKLEENGWIYKGKYSGYYCISDEAYYEENELIKGTDGKFRTELGKECEWKEEETYFFRLSEFQEILLALYKYYPSFVQPDFRKNEVIAFVSGLSIKDFEAGEEAKKDYLKDLSISRNNFSWGIPVPGNESHVMYVWLDALFNYVSALGGLDGTDYKKYWESSDKFLLDTQNFLVKSLSGENKIHIVGKDILRFHTVYWPAFLIGLHYSREKIEEIKKAKEASDRKHYFFYLIAEILELGDIPAKVFAHGYWNAEGKKMSKSLGNVIAPKNEIDWLMSEYGISQETAVDYFRYYMLNEMPFGNDGDYSRERFVNKINSELVNNIGNLAQRSLSMIFKNCEGKIPNFSCHSNTKQNCAETENLISEDQKILNYFTNGHGLYSTGDNGETSFYARIERSMEYLSFEKYIEELIKFSSLANEYMEHNAPWKLAKEGKTEEMEKVLYVVAESVRKIAILLQPFCPYSAKKILDQLQIPANEREFKFLDWSNNFIKGGTEIEKPEGIFPRLQRKN